MIRPSTIRPALDSGRAARSSGLAVVGEAAADALELVAIEDVGGAELAGVPVLGGEGLDLGGEAEGRGERRAEGDHAVARHEAGVAGAEGADDGGGELGAAE